MKAYEIVRKDDLSMGAEMGYANKIVRLSYHVKLNDDTPLLDIAKEIVKGLKTPVNSLTVFFWKEGQKIGREVAYASIDWAPYGKWESADTVKSGDYANHEYYIAWGNE